MRSEPDVPKRRKDFELVFWSHYEKFKNPEYVQYMEEHRSAYEKALNGTVYGGEYHGAV